MNILEAFDIYRFYHNEEAETLALRGVSLELHQTEMVAVKGPSGSGKSTLLACLCGLDEPDGGYVTVMGERITRRPDSVRARIRAGRIGVFLQSGNLFGHLSVEDNIRLAMALAGKRDSAYLDALVERMGLKHVRQALPDRISGGEASRTGLAVALATRPKALLADEPTGEVDRRTEMQILDLLEEYRQGGGAVLVVTHSDPLAARASRILHLFDGRLVTHD